MAEQSFRLILASASPRRRELLAQAGYSFEVHAADIDESQRAGESPSAYVLRLAEEKAHAVLSKHTDQTDLIVLGADTTVVLDDTILGKPADAADAREMLRRLSGRTHQVLTGIAAATRAGISTAVESTDVTFSEIPEAELDAYCATSEPLDKAGAYGIQGYAARWIPCIDGCYFNVMGLPIARTVRLIKEAARGSYRHA
ncbi:MAG TPA: Maf family protein [Acidobacteriaceae bacterium]|nr:Maf family protein [Acidobacteriaceae bacterium]